VSAFTLDTNILIYSLDRDAGNRHGVAKQVMLRAPGPGCLLMLQAVSEFYAAATRKRLVHPDQAAAQAEDWLTLFPVAAPTAASIRTAMRVAATRLVSYWDALLVATAAEAGCTAILTEDMADGSVLLGVRIINPFAGGAMSVAAAALLGASAA
jgi:predicted nucleic acid-binding protein